MSERFTFTELPTSFFIRIIILMERSCLMRSQCRVIRLVNNMGMFICWGEDEILRKCYLHFLIYFRYKHQVDGKPSPFYMFATPHPHINKNITDAFYHELQEYNRDPMIWVETHPLSEEQLINSLVDKKLLAEMLDDLANDRNNRELI
jgi:hypothetical protein